MEAPFFRPETVVDAAALLSERLAAGGMEAPLLRPDQARRGAAAQHRSSLLL